MRKYEQQLLYNIYGFIRKQPVDCIIEDEKQWEELMSLAISQKVLPIIYDSVGMSGMTERIPLKFRGIWKNLAWQEIALQIQRTSLFFDFYQKLLKQDIKCLVVKGIVCRMLYPNPDARISGDEDLYLDRRDFSKFRKICLESGFISINEDEREWAFLHEDSGLKLEVHFSLFDEQSKSCGDFNLPFQNSIENAVAYDMQGTKIWTMNETDHILYLILHSFKHFLHSGVGVRQACDIIVFAEHFGNKIQWKQVFHELCKVHADVFLMNVLDIGVKHFGFLYEKAGIPEKIWNRYRKDMDSEALLKDFLLAGVYGTSTASRTHSSLITLNAVAAARENKNTKGSLFQTIFPNRRNMEGELPLLKEHGFLLPVAWGKRILRYGMEVLCKKKQTSNSTLESIQIGNHRVELLKKYKIIP